MSAQTDAPDQATTDQQGGGEFTKVEKQFTEKFGQFVALLKGPGALKKTKIANDDAVDAVDELLAERKEAARVEFKKDVSNLLDAYSQFEKEMGEAQKSFQKMVTDKRKEFIKKMDGAMSKVENVKSLEASYRRGLATVAEGVEAQSVPSLTDTKEAGN